MTLYLTIPSLTSFNWDFMSPSCDLSQCDYLTVATLVLRIVTLYLIICLKIPQCPFYLAIALLVILTLFLKIATCFVKLQLYIKIVTLYQFSHFSRSC